MPKRMTQNELQQLREESFERTGMMPFEWIVSIYNRRHRKRGEKRLTVGNARLIERQAMNALRQRLTA